eukprot:GHRR01017726.1.p3 GENE.GHRR01017726.1~~GHRR01017726.1.p3  ORF type:complete len:101 (-),score=28.30 GHRR01017726.1:1085-1387(-)
MMMAGTAQHTSVTEDQQDSVRLSHPQPMCNPAMGCNCAMMRRQLFVCKAADTHFAATLCLILLLLLAALSVHLEEVTVFWTNWAIKVLLAAANAATAVSC